MLHANEFLSCCAGAGGSGDVLLWREVCEAIGVRGPTANSVPRGRHASRKHMHPARIGRLIVPMTGTVANDLVWYGMVDVCDGYLAAESAEGLN